MRGVISFERVSNAVLSNSNFTFNDGGPMLEQRQIVGVRDENSQVLPRASLIFVGNKHGSLKI